MIRHRPGLCEEVVAIQATGQRQPGVPRWIVLFEDSGELGNRLVSYAHLLAMALEYRVTVVNLAFWRYEGLFDGLRRPRSRVADQLGDAFGPMLLKVPIVGNWVRRRCTFDGRLVLGLRELAERAASFALVRACRWRVTKRTLEGFCVLRHEKIEGHTFSLCMPKGSNEWALDPRLVAKHAGAIRSRFRPTAACGESMAGLIEPFRNRFSMLVGVHVRRGDYRRYKGGRWYYTDTVYRRVMSAVTDLYPQERIGFLVASDEPVDLEHFAPLEVVRPPGHLLADMYSLAACDLILGPPSTFSGWASFVGNVPIYWIDDERAEPRLEDLKTSWSPCWY